ncbi:unnamed protein product [Effrenium voratum]|nr:unnamed protein product [Effrenium voratum]
MARFGVLLLVLLTRTASATKVRSSSHLRDGASPSRRLLRGLGKDGLEARARSLQEEIGELEVALEKSNEKNSASLAELEKQLNDTASQFPGHLPLRSEGEKTLGENISKTEALIADAHQQVLAHGDVAERARTELEQLAKTATLCNCSKGKLAFLQLEGGHVRPHLTEEQIAAMVRDLSTGFTSSAAGRVQDAPDAAEDETLVIEGLVRKVEELERQRAELEAAQSRAYEIFRQAQDRLLDQSKTASRELYAAKLQAVREEEAAKKRERALLRQRGSAQAMLRAQEQTLLRLKQQSKDYAARIQALFSALKSCGCVKGSAWQPDEVTTTVTSTTTTAKTTLPQVDLVRERQPAASSLTGPIGS